MRSLLRLSKTVVFAFALGSGLSAAPAMATPPTAAAAAVGYTIEYYSDATYSELVGEFVRNCNGVYSWGRRTAYAITYYDEPC